jgi:hypothetical protein
MAGSDPDSAAVLRFIGSFTAAERPEVVALTGGEPLLRPAVVEEVAQRCHAVGTRVHVLTGMFFARGSRVPGRIREALLSVDHVAASLDRFHEAEVPRAAVFRVFAELVAQGQDVSLQVVGLDGQDPYVERLVQDVRREFRDRVPVLVSAVRPEGRARAWMPADGVPAHEAEPEPRPCTMAAWPVVCSDGRITACCNQKVVDGRGPAHLSLGHAATLGWPEIAARCRRDVVLRAIRSLGPPALSRLAGTRACGGYCQTCHALADAPDLPAAVEDSIRPELLELMDGCVAAVQRGAGAQRFAERFGTPGYAELVTLGASEEAAECRAD